MVRSMNPTDLKSWRKRLGLNQFEAAKKLGVGRASIQYWEQELWPIPRVIELACHQMMRRWKRRPEFGPVLLISMDDPIWRAFQMPYQVIILPATVGEKIERGMRHVDRVKQGAY